MIIDKLSNSHLYSGLSERKYIDVQFVAKGKELMGYAPLENQKVIDEYNEQNDITFFRGEKSFVKVDEGMFAIFFPEDIHMPGIKVGERSQLKKVVIKVKV